MELLSVIIPVYNGVETIADTLKSVLAQTYRNIEAIVINDGSTDPTLDIVNGFSDDRLKVYSFENTGLSVSRNRGIKKASGEYISFIDADDLWAPDKLEAQLNALKKDLSADVAYSWTDIIKEDGTPLKMGLHARFEGNVYNDMLKSNFIESGSNILVKRRAIDETGGFDEALAGAADWDYYIRLARKYKFIKVPMVQVYYRYAPRNMSCDAPSMLEDSKMVIKKAFGDAPPELQDLKSIAMARVYRYLAVKIVRGGGSFGNLVSSFSLMSKAVFFYLKYTISKWT